MSSRLQKLNKNYFHILFLLMVCLSVLILTDNTVIVMQQTGEFTTKKKDITIVIDAGHGGRDPGKVGINGAQEKDVNLSIALKLKTLLEQNDIKVIMTRVEDIGLYSESDSNKKVADMRKRVDIINGSKADLAISIHQNSFTQESIRGAQVFYYTNSLEGKSYAEIMQAQMKETLQDGNKRVAKSNDSYFMLKKVECPIVIMECGYLSNSNEAALLVDEAYQERLAWAIHLGLMRYINNSVASAH
jgi:N-acetylmuramoyl-L-alanine amidase